MNALAGVLRLRIRRDRAQLIVWLAVFFLLVLATAKELNSTYGSPADRDAVVRLAVGNTTLLLVRGAPQGTSLGEVVTFQILAFVGLLMGVMTSMLAVRHIRADEEAGRAELLGSSTAGRRTPGTATLVWGLLASVLAGLVIAVGLVAVGLPVAGSLTFGLGCAVTGVTFLGVGLIAAQLFSTSRTANAVGITTVGVAWVVRGIGDIMGSPAPDGLSASIGWVSWLSPIGWAQSMKPYAANSLLPGLIGLLISAVLIALGLRLQAGRDVGEGLIPTRPGPTAARAVLASPLGLAWRLQRGSLYAWAIGAVLLAVLAAELVPQALADLQANGALGNLVTQLTAGGTGSVEDLFIAGMGTFIGLVITGLALQTIMRLRQEEASGRSELALAGPVTRWRWLAAFVALATLGSVVAAVVCGLLAGATGARAGATSDFGKWLATCLAQLPAVFVFLAVLTLVYAVVPRWTVGLGWALFGLGAFLGEFGGLLNVPGWLRDLAPSTHTPTVPAAGASWTGALTMVAVGVVAIAVAGVAFRRRDVVGQ